MECLVAQIKRMIWNIVGRGLVLALGSGCAHPVPPPVPPSEWEARMDWDSAAEALVQHLSAYLQVDTINPPGNETAGALYLKGLLDAEGITSEILEFAPGRGSLIARLPGAGAEAPLCLLSHIDGAGVEADRWPEGRGPLSGTIDDKGVWGRAALDMKGLGMIQVETMLWLERLGIPLRRDVVLLAVADEEDGNAGIQDVITRRWPELACSQVLNEGGIGLKGLLFEDQTVYVISTGEKGVLWLRMVASGPAGHGSVPRAEYAPAVLREAMTRIAAKEPEISLQPATRELLAAAGSEHGGLAGRVLRGRLSVNLLVKPRLADNPLTLAGMTHTVHLTGFGGGETPNVVPSEAWATYDVRVLPGVEPAQVLAELQALVADLPVRFEVVQSRAGNESPVDDPFYAALVRRTRAADPGSAVGPAISVGFTDSIYLRPLGARAYGFVPFALDEAELATMHGHGEFVSRENLDQGLRVVLGAVADVAMVRPGG